MTRQPSAPPAAQPPRCNCKISAGIGAFHQEDCNVMRPAAQDTADGVAEALTRRLNHAMRDDPAAAVQIAFEAIAEARRLQAELAAQKQSTIEWHQMYLDGVLEIDRLRAAAPDALMREARETLRELRAYINDACPLQLSAQKPLYLADATLAKLDAAIEAAGGRLGSPRSSLYQELSPLSGLGSVAEPKDGD